MASIYVKKIYYTIFVKDLEGWEKIDSLWHGSKSLLGMQNELPLITLKVGLLPKKLILNIFVKLEENLLL